MAEAKYYTNKQGTIDVPTKLITTKRVLAALGAIAVIAGLVMLIKTVKK